MVQQRVIDLIEVGWCGDDKGGIAFGQGGGATGGTQSIINDTYASWVGEPYAITPVYIEATQGFQEVLQWPALVTTNATARLFSRLRGYLIRNAQ